MLLDRINLKNWGGFSPPSPPLSTPLHCEACLIVIYCKTSASQQWMGWTKFWPTVIAMTAESMVVLPSRLVGWFQDLKLVHWIMTYWGHSQAFRSGSFWLLLVSRSAKTFSRARVRKTFLPAPDAMSLKQKFDSISIQSTLWRMRVGSCCLEVWTRSTWYSVSRDYQNDRWVTHLCAVNVQASTSQISATDHGLAVVSCEHV